MENIIIIAVVAAVLFLAARYVYKAKKNGARCIGCPSGCACSSESCGSCSCGCGEKK